jgi:hypothetical protein
MRFESSRRKAMRIRTLDSYNSLPMALPMLEQTLI